MTEINLTCLDENYSTTCLLTREKPKIELQGNGGLNTVLFLSVGEEKKVEGGLRTKGLFKKNLKNKSLISIITVVFNGVEYLEETIMSVIKQSYDNIEYIIVDGGSTDGTLDIIRKYDFAIDYWVSENDKGIYDAMNKGITLALGGWVNFMNAGDVFFQKDVIENVSNDLSVDIIYGNHTAYNEDLGNYQIVDVKNRDGKRNIPYCHQAVFIKLEILKKVKFDLRYKIAADYDQYLKLINMESTVKHINTVIVKYLDGGLSDLSRKELIQEYFDVTRKYSCCSAFFVYFIRRIQYFLFGV